MAGKEALIALLGAPALVDGRHSRPLHASEKTLALLALLVCDADRPLSRAWLSSMLWPDIDEAEGRTNLRRHFYKLGKALPRAPGGAEPFVLTKNTAQWSRALAADVVEFRQYAAAGDSLRAVQLYRGPLCRGLNDDAIAGHRMQLEQTYAHLLETEVQNAVVQNDLPRRIAAAHRLVQLDPLNERAARELAVARYESGDRPAAVRDLSAIGARIRTELEAEPEAETVELLNKLLERAEGARKTNLPLYATSLIGRESEPPEIAASLRTHRFVTLTGPGGIGKTRLAVFCARTWLSTYEDGTVFLDLAGSRSMLDVVGHVASALQISLGARDAAQAVLEALAERRMLLLADNCEQLDEDVAGFFERLIAQTHVHILATSRRRLDISHEVVIPVGPLQTPVSKAGTGDIAHAPAVRLFLERAAVVAPALRITSENALHFRAVAEWLDGLPLAIELVAARANLLTMEGIAKKLTAAPDAFSTRTDISRHATVAAALQWSYDLLDPPERMLLERLAVFAGRFDVEACEQICADEDVPAERTFDVLSELVESSLVVASEREDGQCYSLLVPVRTFLAKKLAGEEERWRKRHAAHYLNVAAQFARDRERKGNSAYIRAVRAHAANLEAAARFFHSRGDLTSLARAVSYLGSYWHYTGLASVHTAFFDAVRGHLDECGLQGAEKAQLIVEIGRFLSNSGDWRGAKTMHAQAADLFESAGERWRAVMERNRVCHADSYLGVSLERGIVPRIERLLKDLDAIPDAPPWLRAILLHDIGSMRAHYNDKDPTVMEYLTESLRIVREEQQTDYMAMVLVRLSMLYTRRGRFDLALQCFEDGLIDALERGGMYTILANTLRTRADTHAVAGHLPEAVADALRALECLDQAYEQRYLCYTLNAIMRILLRFDRPVEALHAAGYLKALVERSTFRFDGLYMFGEPEFVALKERLGTQFDEHVAYGAGLRLAHIRGILRSLQTQDPREDDSGTIASV